jgi:hypothetical protein
MSLIESIIVMIIVIIIVMVMVMITAMIYMCEAFKLKINGSADRKNIRDI